MVSQPDDQTPCSPLLGRGREEKKSEEEGIEEEKEEEGERERGRREYKEEEFRFSLSRRMWERKEES